MNFNDNQYDEGDFVNENETQPSKFYKVTLTEGEYEKLRLLQQLSKSKEDVRDVADDLFWCEEALDSIVAKAEMIEPNDKYKWYNLRVEEMEEKAGAVRLPKIDMDGRPFIFDPVDDSFGLKQEDAYIASLSHRLERFFETLY